MTFLRRDKGSDKDSIEEFRRVRQALGNTPTPSPVETPSPAAPKPASPASVKMSPDGNQPAPTLAPASDPLQKYRQGATTVAKDTAFQGTLKSESNLYIEGNFDGELEARATIFVAPGANVKAASIRATDVIVAGSVDGTVDAGSRFHAMPTAHVKGEIKSSILVIDQGSHINCRFVMKARGENKGS